ncbi:MAG: hypothetical protein Q8O57_01380, partial [Kiritimatiellota bacterium]|nr:hypothetical protein [Kiritimatiellota bacterium]
MKILTRFLVFIALTWSTVALAAAPVITAPIQSLITDAVIKPTTAHIKLTEPNNAVRIWTGDQPVTESSFDLYVCRNGGSAVKVRCFRWQGRILTGKAGDVFSFGTTNGRALKIAQMMTPASLTTPSGVTGAAHCDKAGPPLWSPSAAHIVLPAPGAAFQINADGSERDVFISEYDGVQWTPLRWVKLPAGNAVKVRCNYQQIALANYAGAALNITAPAGSSIGGKMARMS